MELELEWSFDLQFCSLHLVAPKRTSITIPIAFHSSYFIHLAELKNDHSFLYFTNFTIIFIFKNKKL